MSEQTNRIPNNSLVGSKQPHIRLKRSRFFLRFPRMSPRLSMVLYFMLPVFVLILLIAAGLLAVRAYYARADVLSEEQYAQYDIAALGSKEGVPVLLQKYIKAQGGLQALQNLERLTFEGTLIESGRMYVFKGSRGRAGEQQLTLMDRASGIQLEFDGEPTVSGDSKVNSKIRLLASLLLMGEFYDPFSEVVIESRGEILQVERMLWREIPVICVCIDRPHLGMRSELYLSEGSMVVLGRTDTLADQSTRSYRYSHYNEVEGVRLPFTINTEGEDGTSIRIQYRRIRSQPAVDTEQPQQATTFSEVGIYFAQI